VDREDEKRRFILGIELRRAHLLCEVDVAEDLPARLHGRAQERLHRRVVGREADMARIPGDVWQPQRLGISNQHAKDSLADRERSNRPPLLNRDAGRNEVQQPAVRTDDAEGSIARVCQFDRQLDDPL
jgi:hypothetical protein